VEKSSGRKIHVIQFIISILQIGDFTDKPKRKAWSRPLRIELTPGSFYEGENSKLDFGHIS